MSYQMAMASEQGVPLSHLRFGEVPKILGNPSREVSLSAPLAFFT